MTSRLRFSHSRNGGSHMYAPSIAQVLDYWYASQLRQPPLRTRQARRCHPYPQLIRQDSLMETIDERDEPVPVLQEGDQDLAIVVEVDEIVVPRFDEDLMVVEEQNGEGVLERERRGFIRRAIEHLYFTFERVFGGF
ncbi:hypothetical protein PLEOSDRAFT_1099554 [Pleurotus ostreatus PC15]|uniref:Uncharacterized protein n=1 Tax=Pleurotus ostreatus (strain PC15) TaxID=1137138 RepID=A0A067PAZ3_PLEO1|nr:hypothetical protein PLEOSDRAFT_1099554 [Pleurotus ostreatus PC15]